MSEWVRHDTETDRGVLTWWICDPCECVNQPAGPFAQTTTWASIHPECSWCTHFVYHTIRLK